MKRARTELNAEQERVIAAAIRGDNVFMTGSAGTGKSMVIKAVVEELESQGRIVAVTSSTGISAINIGGETVHRWARIGLGTEPVATLVLKKGIKKQWKNTDTLIIDEISMISKELFDILDAVGKNLRRSAKPFGGMQVIASGDFYQLAPVKGDYAFLSENWSETFPTVVELTTVYRQTDLTLTRGLHDMRRGKLTREFVDALRKDKADFYARGQGVLPTRLFAVNRQVDEVNRHELAALPDPHVTYASTDSGAVSDDMFRIPKQQVFAVGAQVMFMVNKPGSYMNGTRGVISKLDPNLVTVKLLNGRIIEVQAHAFEFKRRDVVTARRVGIPLTLAWAISIHKSQGLSIDYLDVDLSKVFTAAQAYVAMSRATTIEGLRVEGLTGSKVYCDPTVLAAFPRVLETQSRSEAEGRATEISPQISVVSE